MKRRFRLLTLFLLLALTFAVVVIVQAWTPLPVVDDPLVRMPGTQPGQVALESPNRCLNCHGGYNTAVEPGFNWMGSMMAQSARDPLFWSAMTVAAQDAIWATGTPNATDICERCHFPKGWLEGRSDPTNAAAMTGADYDGVQCDFCHRMVDPFFETTFAGAREGNDWLNDWDETNAGDSPSAPAALATYNEDATIAQGILLFNGQPFFTGNLPPADYTESGSGQYFVSPNADKRASFADAAARHQMFYSRFHKSKYFCNSCHDVSNPVLANLTMPGGANGELPTELASAAGYFHVERTFSEFMLSAYGQQGGAAGLGPFAPGAFETSQADDFISSCQDCHMRDVTGVGADKKGVPVRPDDSVEHPQSGQPLHDLTGGNIWISHILASTVPGSPVYDSFNETLLQNPGALTLDLSAGQGIDPAALIAGRDRARQQLALAASIENVSYDAATGALSFQVQNQTGHKLISGFPEGRRMFLNIRLYDAGGALIYEVNPYDAGAGTLKGLANVSYSDPGGALPPPAALGAGEAYLDALVYEMHPSSTLTGEQETFHFVLGDGRYKDNRIPPQGFDIDGAAARLSQPVWHGVEAPGYFSAAEYAGGYDAVNLDLLPGAATVEINLYYQTTSREYVEFLRDQINGTATTLPASAYIAQADPFFDGLRAWGDAIWQLWTHNRELPGAAPVLMTQATTGGAGGGGGCSLAAPALQEALPAHTQVTLGWSTVAGATGYNVYYDQSDKFQFVADAGDSTTYTDGGLSNGQELCYAVSAYDATCESAVGNTLCATPTNVLDAGVSQVQTGLYQGKGNNVTFVLDDAFAAGDEIVLQATVVDAAGAPLAGAVVDLVVSGPETVSLSTGHSDSSGLAVATWKTSAPRRNQAGTAPGSYTVTVGGLTVDGYAWDGVPTAATFTIQ